MNQAEHTAIKYASSYRERLRQADKLAIPEHVHLAPEIWRICASRFADSILVAHSQSPRHWGLTLLPNLIRLNAGLLEAITLGNGWINVMVDQRALSRSTLRSLRSHDLIVGEAGRYTAAPDAMFVSLPAEDEETLQRDLADLDIAHVAHLREVAGKRVHPRTYVGHHPGLVRAIATATNRPLPQPPWVAQALATLDDAATVELYSEGSRRVSQETKIERSAKARAACLAHYGYKCVACDRSLAAEYGRVASEVIEVHHLRPLADSEGESRVDPIRDLRPVCPNCHAVIHQNTPPFSIDEIRAMRTRTTTHAESD